VNPYKQSFTCAAASLTGYASNATGDTWALSATTANDGLAHQVTIRNDSATDHSAKTAILTGTDAQGNALTETVSLPAGTATVTSTKYFKTLTSVVPSATIDADTMDIGWTAAAQSPLVVLDHKQGPFNVGFAVVVGGTINYDVQHTYDKPNGDDYPTAFNHSSVAAKTANADGTYTSPVRGLRVDVNSHTSGTFTLYVLQGVTGPNP
jgi:hypothetical protein